MKKVLGFIIILLVNLLFYNLNNAIQDDKIQKIPGVPIPLPASYQIVLQELTKSKSSSLSQNTKELIEKNYDLKRAYNLIKNYSELGFTDKEAPIFYQALLHLDLVKFNALINFIEKIKKLLNYDNFPVPREATDKYNEIAVGTMDEFTKTSMKETISQQDIIEIRKSLLKGALLITIFKYGINKELLKDRLENIYQNISNLNTQFFENAEIKKKLDSLIMNLFKVYGIKISIQD